MRDAMQRALVCGLPSMLCSPRLSTAEESMADLGRTRRPGRKPLQAAWPRNKVRPSRPRSCATRADQCLCMTTKTGMVMLPLMRTGSGFLQDRSRQGWKTASDWSTKASDKFEIFAASNDLSSE